MRAGFPSIRRRVVWLVLPVLAATAVLVDAVGCSAIIGDVTERGADASVRDGGSDSATPGDGSTDAGSLPGFDVEAAPPPPAHAKITFVHAAPGVFPVRLCVATGATPTLAVGIYPFPNNVAQQRSFQYSPYLGLQSGSGATLPDLGDLEDVDVTLFAINAKSVAGDTSAMGTSEPDCADLLGANGKGADGGGLVLGTDYIQLPAIRSGVFTHGGSFLLVMEGCLGGNTNFFAANVCGFTYDSAHEMEPFGNVSLQVYQLDNNAPAVSTLGLQVLHASSAWDGYYLLESAPLNLSAVGNTFDVTDSAVDGGPVNPSIATLISYGAPLMPDAAAPQMVAPTDYDRLHASVSASTLDAGSLITGVSDAGAYSFAVVTEAFSFPVIQQFSGYGYAADGGLADPLYLPGANFTLVWVGDPRQPAYLNPDGGSASTADAGVLNPGSAHFLMFPNDPPVPPL